MRFREDVKCASTAKKGRKALLQPLQVVKVVEVTMQPRLSEAELLANLERVGKEMRWLTGQA